MSISAYLPYPSNPNLWSGQRILRYGGSGRQLRDGSEHAMAAKEAGEDLVISHEGGRGDDFIERWGWNILQTKKVEGWESVWV